MQQPVYLPSSAVQQDGGTVHLRPYYSMSQMRSFYSEGGCTYVFYLKYIRGYREKMSAIVFLGHIMHQFIQELYHGIDPYQAHQHVWTKACAAIYEEMETWYALDLAYHTSGNPNTKARQLWTEQHPQHAELAAAIEAYRDDFLTQEYTWAKSASLTGYYRWARTLLAVPSEHYLLPHPTLVEGQPLFDENSAPIPRFADAQSVEEDHYHMLHGKLANGLPVAGVPDVFGVDGEGIAWLADYKVMSSSHMSEQDLAEDGQLALYAELLRQNGHIAAGQRVRVGHIYLTERRGVQHIWTTPSPHALPRLARQLEHMDRRIRANDFMPVRGIATGSKLPCPDCGLASVCPSRFEGVGPAAAIAPFIPSEEEQ
jgi:PD-(D/E)XK nuclease superfamily